MHKQQGWPQAWEYCQAKPIQTLGRASQGVNWSWSQCIKSSHSQTSSGKGQPIHFWNRNIVRSILPGIKRKITRLLLSGPKSSFQMKVHLAFNLEIKVWSLERHRIHVSWSPVWSFHSQWWFGLPCHLLVLVHCVFWLEAIYREILEHFMLPSADKLYFFHFPVGLGNWLANLSDLNPIENLWVIVKRKMRDTRPNNADDLKTAIKATWASITPEQCHWLVASMPRRISWLNFKNWGNPLP